MKEICQSFATKAQLNFEKLIFIYGGTIIDYELSYEKQANSTDIKNNLIKILAYEFENCNEKKLNEMAKNDKLTETNIKDIISKDLRNKGKELLSKHLDGRSYKEDKVDKWIKTILDECEQYFKEKYLSYHLFMLCDVCSKDTYFYTNKSGLLNLSKERYIFSIFKTEELFSCIHLFFFKDFISVANSCLEPKILSYGNKLLYEIFDERKFDKNMVDYCLRFNTEFEKYFHKLDNKRRIYNVTNAFKKPLKNFSYSYRAICPYHLSTIVQTFFTKDTEIYHYAFIFSNDK